MNSNHEEIITFADVRPGDHALDLLAGDGNFTQPLAHRVGDTGKVYLHNTARGLSFFREALENRISANRWQNVIRMDCDISEIELPSGSLDHVFMLKVYHDLYFTAPGWSTSPDMLFEVVNRLIKRSGVLTVIDHSAEFGSGNRDSATLHRIEPHYVREDIEKYGFKLDAELSILSNPLDTHTLAVWDQQVADKTDRFTYRFIKSEDAR